MRLTLIHKVQLEYIASELKKGVTINEVIARLKNAKWNDSDIEAAFNRFEKESENTNGSQITPILPTRLLVLTVVLVVLVSFFVSDYLFADGRITKYFADKIQASYLTASDTKSKQTSKVEEGYFYPSVAPTPKDPIYSPNVANSEQPNLVNSTDLIVNCQFPANCGNQVVQMKDSECKAATCCQVFNEWLPMSQIACSDAQQTANKIQQPQPKKEVLTQINQRLAQAKADYYEHMYQNSLEFGSSQFSGTNYISPLYTYQEKKDVLPIFGKGNYYTDSLGFTHYQGQNGVNITAYTDSLGFTHAYDYNGNTITSWTDSLGFTRSYDNNGSNVGSYTDSLGFTNYSGNIGGENYSGKSESIS